ncbi:MAG TPA: glycerol-3-phosphate dehydrogenase, partial [Alphaproteobacteria bacterium]|nr:glycerol-3-phosphate dehydrogenase [Alphaproteobacteria bacterium]
MQRDVQAMAAQSYDVLVVGGGITGSCIARDAAMRGLKVALIERRDWSSGTSSASSKLVHGGLRYLKSLEFGLIRESLAERRIWERIAPHLVRPLPFLVPFFKEGLGQRLTLRAGLTLYDWLSYDKAWLDDPEQRLPGHRMLTRAEVIAREPNLDVPGLTGALVYYDCQMDSPERLGLECVIDAMRSGARAANYVEALEFLRDGAKVAGVRARDTLNGTEYQLRAQVTINAAGPWADLLLQQMDNSPVHLMRSKGIHVIVPALTKTHALTVQHKGKHFFVLPWRGHTILGTTDTPFQDHPDAVRPGASDIDDLLRVVNEGIGFTRLTSTDVRHAYAGLRPLIDDGSSSSYNASRKSEIVDHGDSGAPALFSVIGGKWTTSRHVAQQAVDLVQKTLKLPLTRAATSSKPLPGGNFPRRAQFRADVDKALPHLSPEVREALTRLHGSAYADVLCHAKDDPGLLSPVSNGVSDTGAAVLHAARAEMAVTLSDVVFRRSGLGGLGHPGRAALDRAAELMARHR